MDEFLLAEQLLGKEWSEPHKILYVATTVLFFKEFLLPFVRHFRQLGWRVDGAAGRNRGWEESLETFDHLYVLELSRKVLGNHPLQSLQQLRHLVIEQGYKLVHVHTPIAGAVVRWALRDLQRQGKVKVIYTAHGFHFHPKGNPLKNLIFYSLERLLAQWTDYIVVMNQADQKAAQELVGVNHTVYMPGIGVDVAHYAQPLPPNAAAAIRSELGLSQEPLFLMVAEFNPGKHHDHAVRALARMRHSKAHLALAGVGPMEARIKQLVSQLGLNQRVHFLGWRQDIPSLLEASDALVLPSEREGLPRAIMEAFCRCVPVVATRIRGIQDLVGEEAGLLLDVGDVDGLARSMDWIAEHPEEAKQMGIQGRKRMDAFDLRHILRLHEQLYSQAVQSSPLGLQIKSGLS